LVIHPDEVIDNRCMANSPRHLLGPHALSHADNLKPFRASNDYFPDIPGSHAYHIYTNIFASQFLSCITIPDFDMFQTHPFVGGSGEAVRQGPFHAALRALGNGPVTVTDVHDHCVPEVFMRIAGVGRNGKTIALNSDRPIEVLNDRCFDDVAQRGDGKAVRGYAKSKWGVVMGIWNVRSDHGMVRDSVSLDDVATVFESQKVICWSHARQEVFILKSDPGKVVVLQELEFDVLSLVEMKEDIVCLGLIDKYNTLAAIDARKGRHWMFRCLGEAVWVVAGHPRVVIKVEGTAISSVRWALEDVTIVRASLGDFKETGISTEKFWTVEVVVTHIV
jgi:predicted secreted protein